METSTLITWILIGICITQSALFSGLNLAVFSISRLRLEVETSTGNKNAQRVLDLRQDSNFILTTILWGNVGINCLLTLLSDSILTGLMAFLFSTFAITFFGEITPQAYCSRNALKAASIFSPVLRFYQFLLYPVAKPTAKLLDLWLGKEGVHYLREKDISEMIKRHMKSDNAEIDKLEGLGALNFLAMDDMTVYEEGEYINPDSVIMLPVRDNRTVFPDYSPTANDPFLRGVQASGKKWVIITDKAGEPRYALDSDAFLRAVLFTSARVDPLKYCHVPVIVRDPKTLLGEILPKLKLLKQSGAEGAHDRDIILVWTDHKRVITGTDILDRLLHGISNK